MAVKQNSIDKSLNYMTGPEEYSFSNYKNRRLRTTSKKKTENFKEKIINFSKSSPPKSKNIDMKMNNAEILIMKPNKRDSMSLYDQQLTNLSLKNKPYNLKSVGYKANILSSKKKELMVSPSFVFEDDSNKDISIMKK